ncbi:TOM1-like protein 2 [Leucoagaricus sp. SymC.cos]|nr:TOM1-like protein 2 [Leucoagaricus sp. SymC.cos]
MLRNCSEEFVSQSMSRKFLDTIEELLMSPRTSPVVRERLMDVIAAAAYASQSNKNDRGGFRGLWRRVKPIDKPDEGMPFSVDDPILNPPVINPRSSQYGSPIHSPEPVLPPEAIPPASPPPPVTPSSHMRRKSPTRNRITPHDEDVRRLLQECKIGQGNAGVLSQALFHAKPESFKKDPVVREFYRKCRASQELIYAQIPWVTVEAENSNVAGTTKGSEYTQLLDVISAANGELLEVLKQYEDMDRVATKRKAEYRSMKEIRSNSREHQDLSEQQRCLSLEQHYSPSAPRDPFPPPSIRNSSSHLSLDSRHSPRHDSSHDSDTLLAPPTPVTHGSPSSSPAQFSVRSRSSSLVNIDSRETNGVYSSPNPESVEFNFPGSVHQTSNDDTLMSVGDVKDQCYVLLREIMAFSPQKKLLTQLSGADAQHMIDFLTELLEDQSTAPYDRTRILHLSSKLAKSAQVFPSVFELVDVQCDLINPFVEGGYGYIYKGEHGGRSVCVKAVRRFDGDVDQRTLRVSILTPWLGLGPNLDIKAHAGELIIWAHLSHPNILPFQGIFLSNEQSPRVCIVSLWMENGDLQQYLKTFPDSPRTPLVCSMLRSH